MSDIVEYNSGSVRVTRSDGSFDSIDASAICSLSVDKPDWNVWMVLGAVVTCVGSAVGTVSSLSSFGGTEAWGVAGFGFLVFFLAWLLRRERLVFRTVDGKEVSARYSEGSMDKTISVIVSKHLRE